MEKITKATTRHALAQELLLTHEIIAERINRAKVLRDLAKRALAHECARNAKKLTPSDEEVRLVKVIHGHNERVFALAGILTSRELRDARERITNKERTWDSASRMLERE